MMIIHYRLIEKNTYRVITNVGGENVDLGTVKNFYISHLKRRGWEATDANGQHVAVHEHRWQASFALKWSLDGQKGYPPFPVHSKHKAEMEEIG